MYSHRLPIIWKKKIKKITIEKLATLSLNDKINNTINVQRYIVCLGMPHSKKDTSLM